MTKIRAALVEKHPNISFTISPDIVVTEMDDIQGITESDGQNTVEQESKKVGQEDKEKLKPPPSKVKRKQRTLQDLGKEGPDMTIGEYLALRETRKKARNEGRRYAAAASMTETELTEIEKEESKLESLDENGLPKPQSGQYRLKKKAGKNFKSF